MILPSYECLYLYSQMYFYICFSFYEPHVLLERNTDSLMPGETYLNDGGEWKVMQ